MLVNNAGVMPISPLDDLRVAEWEDMIDVNIKGILYGIAALPINELAGGCHLSGFGRTMTQAVPGVNSAMARAVAMLESLSA